MNKFNELYESVMEAGKNPIYVKLEKIAKKAINDFDKMQPATFKEFTKVVDRYAPDGGHRKINKDLYELVFDINYDYTLHFNLKRFDGDLWEVELDEPGKSDYWIEKKED